MFASLIGCIGIVASHHAKNFGIDIKSLKVIVGQGTMLQDLKAKM
ncbi:MAG: hypothetical protein B6U85_01480 [Desulfurococcales archaeon ex4484_42]|nr:MAG: hypothetical protein B6U85_01480 [Desulfurococcales archaeon ex4484_42]